MASSLVKGRRKRFWLPNQPRDAASSSDETYLSASDGDVESSPPKVPNLVGTSDNDLEPKTPIGLSGQMVISSDADALFLQTLCNPLVQVAKNLSFVKI